MKNSLSSNILRTLGIPKLLAQLRKRFTDFPIWTNLEIDIQSACNRDCEFCPRYHDRSGVRKDAQGNQIIQKMPTDQVYRIIDQASSLHFKGKVKLHRLSEGLLDTRYLEFARYIKSKGLILWEDTNGDVLRKNHDLCTQIDGLIDHLTIGLYDYKSEQEKQQEMTFWRGRFQKTELAFSLPPEYCTVRQGSKVYFQVPKDPTVLELPCNQPTYFLQIRYDGNVSLCCEDDGCHFDLGNAFEQSLVELWWSAKHIQIAKTLAKPGGRHHYPHCSRCYRLQDKVNLLKK